MLPFMVEINVILVLLLISRFLVEEGRWVSTFKPSRKMIITHGWRQKRSGPGGGQLPCPKNNFNIGGKFAQQ